MPRAKFTGWCCILGPAELVDYLVDEGHAEEVTYGEFVEGVDVSTAPLDETQFEILDTDWSVTWLKTRLPSGKEAWVMQHAGIEFLFLEGGFDHEEEARLAEVWEAGQ